MTQERGDRPGLFAIFGATFLAWTALVFVAGRLPRLFSSDCGAALEALDAKGVSEPLVVFPPGTLVLAALALIVGGIIHLTRGAPHIGGQRALVAGLTTVSGFLGLYVPQLKTPGLDQAFAQLGGTLPLPTQWMLGSFTVPLAFCVVIWVTAVLGQKRFPLLWVSAAVAVIGLASTVAAVVLPQLTLCTVP